MVALFGNWACSPNRMSLAVFVFDGRGRLVRRWRDVPARDELARALASAPL